MTKEQTTELLLAAQTVVDIYNETPKDDIPETLFDFLLDLRTIVEEIESSSDDDEDFE